MLKRILTAFGIVGSAAASPSGQTTSGPYREDSANVIYQLLFCDRPQLFKQNHKGNLEPPWSVLFSKTPDLEAIAKIAGDKHQESRVRALAFNALRAAGRPVAQKEYLGTVIEVRLPGGLDTLAAFADGGARYINQSGKIVVVEGKPNPFDNEIQKVVEASKPVIAAIGPWDKDRLPAPKEGNIRLTFLVSDGLYFGEGPMDAMQRERMAAPLISAGTALLHKLVQKTTHTEPGDPVNGKQPGRSDTNRASGAAGPNRSP